MAREANTASEVREYVIESLRRELIGPAPGYPMTQLNGEEILRQQDPPRYRYSAGILFPAGVNFSATLDAGEEAADIEAAIPVGEEGVDGKADEAGVEDRPEIEANTSEDKTADTDVEVDPTSTFLPSTMGLSFLARVRGGFRIECRWGTYEKTFVDGVPSHKPDGDPPSFWFRHQRSSTQDYAAEEIRRDKRARLQRRVISHAEDHGSLEIDVVSRPWDEGDARLITVTIINTGRTSRPINENCFFQCSFAIVPAGGMEILEYPGRPVSLQDDEEKSLSLLYRHRPVYAVGHGCAADWDRADGPPTSLRTETMPVFEQPPVLPLEEADGVELSMRRLAEATPTDVAISCRALCAAYRGWIEDRERELASDPDLSPKLKARGRDHLKECRACLVRVEDGISLLEAEPDALEAFQRMNIAMVEQRAHYALAAEDRFRRRWVKKPSGQMPERPFEQPDYPYETKWRPFQLAFVLMNVRSFVRPDSNERSIVDVIWFPTGGGKTEAYLGLAAFVILLRRLRDQDDAGTTVLMRYTLRLLTTQQFQRAASLICALELVRRHDPSRFGDVPISIGLWLGGSVTPNRDNQAVRAFGQLKKDGSDNQFVMLRCPWCGTDMGPHDYDGDVRVFGYAKRPKLDGEDCIRFRCEDPGCAFSTQEGLPLEVVDEGIYREPPTLLIGTVDKFAMMPWNPESRCLFGIDNLLAKTPPELVIQDELHLISVSSTQR